MSGRDLLYKPPVPMPVGDDDTDGKRAATKPGAKARELGSVGEQLARARVNEVGQKPAKDPAYKAAYFNRDISGVRDVNLRARGAQALRGEESATDLRKVVLPPAHGIDNPSPEIIRSAADLMGLEPDFIADFSGFLTRQGAFARGHGVTVEMLEARLAMLAVMVEARKAALERMRAGRAQHLARSKTLEIARRVEGQGMELVDDLAQEGTDVIAEVRHEADGMHRRLAKMLGIKL